MEQLSPGVVSNEISLQTTVERVGTGRAAAVGKFNWGPVNTILQIVSEPELVRRLGQPDDKTADSFFTAANFFSYGNDLRLVRVCDMNAARNSSPVFETVNIQIQSAGSGYMLNDIVTVTNGAFSTTGAVTKVNSTGGIESVFVPSNQIVNRAKEIRDYPDLNDGGWVVSNTSVNGGGATLSLRDIQTDSTIVFTNDEYARSELEKRDIVNDTFIDKCEYFNIPVIASKYPSHLGDDITVIVVDYKDYYKFSSDGTRIIGNNTINPKVFPTGLNYGNITPASLFQFGPENEHQFALIVVRSGTVVESKILSRKMGDRDIYNNSIFIDEYFENGGSQFIQGTATSWPDKFTGALRMGGGNAGNDSVTAGDWVAGWDLFADKETVDVNILAAGSCAGEGAALASTVQKAVVALAEERKDVLATISPPREYLVNKPAGDATAAIVAWRNGVTVQGDVLENNFNVSSSYMMIDGNYKYQYDKYNDKYRWVPLSGDIAGLCAATPQTWLSPAGYTRGQIRNIIKFAIDTRKPHRDSMYSVGINPCLGQAGKGYVLFGDKTGTTVPTPFDRVNVRRLFNMIKTAISRTADYKLFENNDAFTRSSFRIETSAYLDTIRTLGGMYDFRVICDESNNTPEIIDRNQFVATILIKPARSINFITISFVATSTGADLNEIVGSANLG
ncbi:tail sheath protein [Vibrio phage vB_VmeM-32]|nr:tail sheath protein [Vibrio phage vB_VmeM-32]